MYRLFKMFHPVFWRSIAESFRVGADETKGSR